MTEAHIFALGLALACLAGVRAYLTVFGVGLAGLLGWVDLPAALEATTSPWVLGTAGALAFAHPWWALGLLLAVLALTALVVATVARWLWRRVRPATTAAAAR